MNTPSVTSLDQKPDFYPLKNKTTSLVIKNKKISVKPHKHRISLEREPWPSTKKNLAENKRIIVDKQNIFWKIGRVLFKAGLILLSIFGGVYISVSNNGVWAYLGGLFIGLAVLALSGICFLLAILTTYMKQRSKPIDNANEI